MKPIIGNYDFKIVMKEGYYVDKTKIIDEIVDGGIQPKVLVVTRPRRFGKSLMMSMLATFFDCQVDSRAYFKGLAIERSPNFTYLNSRPVIFFSFKNVEARSQGELMRRVRDILFPKIRDFGDEFIASSLTEEEYRNYRRIADDDTDFDALEQSLYLLIKLTYAHHQMKPIVLIDEYDLPVYNAFIDGYLDDVSDFFKHLYSFALKGNEFVSLSILAGVMNNAKDSLSSGLNNVVLDNGLYSVFGDEYFAFNEDEVKRIIADMGATATIEELRDWYGGYVFTNKQCFNPWSVLNFFGGLQKHLVYWANTGSSKMIQSMLANNDYLSTGDFLRLLDGETLEISSDFSIAYKDLNSSKQGAFVELISLGYLNAYYDYDSSEVYAKIPNNEIMQVFKNEIYERFVASSDYKAAFEEFRDGFLRGDAKEVERNLAKITASLSYYSFNDEKNYQILILCITSLLFGKCAIKEEVITGEGRCDVTLFPKKSREFGVVIEIKHLKARTTNDRLLASANKALTQIKKHDYHEFLRELGITKICSYGIAFYKKQVAVVSEVLAS